MSTDFATKTDISDVHHAIELLRKDTTILLLEMKFELIKWIVGMTVGMTVTTILAFVGIIAVFIK